MLAQKYNSIISLRVCGCGVRSYILSLEDRRNPYPHSWLIQRVLVHWRRSRIMMSKYFYWQCWWVHILYTTALAQLMIWRYKIWVWLSISRKCYKKLMNLLKRIYLKHFHHFCGYWEISHYVWRMNLEIRSLQKSIWKMHSNHLKGLVRLLKIKIKLEDILLNFFKREIAWH